MPQRRRTAGAHLIPTPRPLRRAFSTTTKGDTMKPATPSACQPGAIVRPSSEFCRSISWHTNVPVNGIVLSATEVYADRMLCRVRWCDRDESVSVLASNLDLAPGNATISDGMRASLLAEFGEAVPGSDRVRSPRRVFRSPNHEDRWV